MGHCDLKLVFLGHQGPDKGLGGAMLAVGCSSPLSEQNALVVGVALPALPWYHEAHAEPAPPPSIPWSWLLPLHLLWPRGMGTGVWVCILEVQR